MEPFKLEWFYEVKVEETFKVLPAVKIQASVEIRVALRLWPVVEIRLPRVKWDVKLLEEQETCKQRVRHLLQPPRPDIVQPLTVTVPPASNARSPSS